MATISHLDTHQQLIVLKRRHAELQQEYQDSIQIARVVTTVIKALGAALAIAICSAPYLFIN